MKDIRHKNKRSSRKKLLAIALAVVLVVVAGLLAFKFVSSDRASVAEELLGEEPTKTVVTEGQEIEMPEDVDEDLIKNYELIAETEQYKIRKYGGEYTVTLFAIINNPNQYDWYQDQLREYKAAALAEMRDQGINIEEASIIYEPEEAAEL